MTSFKLWTLEQQEAYLRKNRIYTEMRKYVFKRFEASLMEIFGNDEYAKEIIEELR